jgi:hypothetical protein
VDNVPISRAIEQGCRRIFVLLCGPLHYAPTPPRRPIEAVLTAFFIAVHTRFARERENLPPGVEVVVFCVGSEPISRYDDFSATEMLLNVGRSNAERVLDFWEAGGHGEIGVGAGRVAPVETLPTQQDHQEAKDRLAQHVKVPVPPA